MCPLDAGQLFQWAIWVFYASMAQPNVIPTKVTKILIEMVKIFIVLVL
jgi:hypothetical protein